MHRYYEENREAIMEDFRVLGPVEMLKKWGIASSTWTYLRRRWSGETLGRTRRTSTKNDETTPVVSETTPIVDEPTPVLEQKDDDLVPVGGRMEQRNTGRTGIRRIYPN